jgi:predicted RNA binding protein YcfA (HicA-like mRNA interferase family)
MTVMGAPRFRTNPGIRTLAPKSRLPTKAQITSLLVNLGFKRIVIKGSHILFKKGASQVCISLAPKLMEATYLATGNYLVLRGHITKDYWQRWINGR